MRKCVKCGDMKVQMGMVALISVLFLVFFPPATPSYSGQEEGIAINDLDKPSKSDRFIKLYNDTVKMNGFNYNCEY